MDDRRAIEASQDGRPEAFRHLVEAYQQQAFGHAFAILNHTEDALDAVQDAFVDAFRAIERFDTRRRFYPWFYTLLRQRCFKVLRGRKRHRQNDSLGAQQRALDEPSQAAVALEQALMELSPEDRELITLKHLDGLSYAQLADYLSIPAGTVMSRLHAARQKLRLRLAEHPSFKTAAEKKA